MKKTENRAILVILDGFGLAKDSKWNAIANSKMPFYRSLVERYPHAQLLTHGEAVGLPAGVMGNSEVGHTTIGAGRVVYQDLTRISKEIRTGEFFENSVLRETIQAGANKTGRVHFMGLLSDGGVHSHIDHLLALLDFCVKMNVPNVSVHAFLDGRDTPPESSLSYFEKLLKHPTFSPEGSGKTKAKIATVMGRYWAMDRDKRWERVEKAYLAMTGQVPAVAGSAIDLVKKSHASAKTDEFVEPLLLDSEAAMRDGDGVVFFNFRADRAREISAAIGSKEFTPFNRGRGFRPSAFAGMTQYEKNLEGMKVAFGPQNLDNIFGQWLEKHGRSQFRIAETEKYAHVTFFFNGGREKAFEKEDRLLIQSPKEVATYDLKPEMSALGVAESLTEKIKGNGYDFILVNFANPDMVGHTGVYDAVISALETIDRCLSQVITAAQDSGYQILLTSDHGNAEEMRDDQGRVHTQHTLNPVPILWIQPKGVQISKEAALKDGSLQDLMPTLCDLMGLPLPPEVTGTSLISK
ncbi:MAG: phosphoglycerate mutase (2,3-diphosphoglycerate-independent) [Bdellovibrionales bacterium RIFOXYC1_FULL_54_43]|nr:MAG: phosphoglycerate mutase (2,3-diphosphoglycerate-independent) [Bdellovibrionales bacterium RIFOXYC1_FULL_54_43]OFZ79814.1 MAG: phosphoglycerate mutase (2,3-diphosphoglycerate-independent) [Bdellovibrionales bacterium RIFOXYD1_FULL_55_31]